MSMQQLSKVLMGIALVSLVLLIGVMIASPTAVPFAWVQWPIFLISFIVAMVLAGIVFALGRVQTSSSKVAEWKQTASENARALNEEKERANKLAASLEASEAREKSLGLSLERIKVENEQQSDLLTAKNKELEETKAMITTIQITLNEKEELLRKQADLLREAAEKDKEVSVAYLKLEALHEQARKELGDLKCRHDELVASNEQNKLLLSQTSSALTEARDKVHALEKTLQDKDETILSQERTIRETSETARRATTELLATVERNKQLEDELREKKEQLRIALGVKNELEESVGIKGTQTGRVTVECPQTH